LDRNANIEARDKLLKTSLHYACEGGHALVVKELMERGADVFDRDNCGRTAMHYAVYSG
jgi:ankyrin repeat protein|tara:strand:+ start:390 stop:566 length:177 start_codon:yes stop_codon:yes gene_type:complete